MFNNSLEKIDGWITQRIMKNKLKEIFKKNKINFNVDKFSSIDELIEKLAELIVTLNQNSSILLDENMKNSRYAEDIVKYREEMKNLYTNIDKIKKENTELREQNKTLNTKNYELSIENNSLKKHYNALQDKLIDKAVQKDTHKEKDAYSGLKAKYTELQEDNKGLKETIEVVSGTVENIQKQNKILMDKYQNKWNGRNNSKENTQNSSKVLEVAK